jgi:hypothetical protein
MRGRPPASRPPRPRTPPEGHRLRKCTSCGILLDIPCTNPVCDGHGNESHGDVCTYCATDARTTHHVLPQPTSPLASTLVDIGHGED